MIESAIDDIELAASEQIEVPDTFVTRLLKIASFKKKRSAFS